MTHYFAVAVIDPDKEQVRTRGVFLEVELAHRVFELNLGDLNDGGWYDYGVVERKKFGLCQISSKEDRTWWKFDYAQKKWVKLDDEPDAIKKLYKQHEVSGSGSWSGIG